MTITTQRDIQLNQLEGELADVGIDVTHGIGAFVDGASTTIHTYNADGRIINLPDEAQSVVDAHEAVPVVNAKIAVIDAMDISDADKAKLKTLLGVS